MKHGWYLLIFLFILAVIKIPGCTPCNDCGPSENYPYVNVKFYNIDSLLKLQNEINIINDSIAVLDELIAGGADSLTSIKSSLESTLGLLQEGQSKITSGQIKIDALNGTGAGKTLYFTDSVTMDTLTSFRFPLDSYNPKSEFIITINGHDDTLGLNYRLNRVMHGNSIIMSATNLSVFLNTYDSAKLTCKLDSCISNETTLSIYF
jgi:hypothetical protein